MSRRIVVVGGGISGLSAAHRLQELAREHDYPLDVSLLEAGKRLGGVVRSRRQDGFLVEEGPDSILTEKPWAMDLAGRLGIDDRVVGTLPDFRKSFVAKGGKLHATPDGFYLLAPSSLGPLVTTPIFSWPGKMRMGLDLVIPRRRSGEDESLAAFVRRRLGREALERMAQPMIAGIYGADPEKLSLMATFPRFHDMERDHRSIILALRAGIKQRKAGPAKSAGASGPRYSLFATFDDGLQVLTDAIAARLNQNTAHTGAPVDAIYPTPGGGWKLRSAGREESADGVILAVPAHQASELVGTFDARLGQKLQGIPYGSAATVCLGYREQDVSHSMDGAGFVIPSAEGLRIVGCTFAHRKYPDRAPEGHVLLRAFHGDASADLSDDGLLEATQRELQGFLGLRGEPVMTHVARWPRSMAHYLLGHIERVDEVWSDLRAHPGLALAGNGYRGIGIPDCVRSGERAAGSVLKQLFPAKAALAHA